MIWKILLTVLLVAAPVSQSTAQVIKAKSLGEAATIGTVLSIPITMEFEIEISGADRITDLLKYMDSQGFSIQIVHHLKKGGDPTLLEKATLNATKTGIFTAQVIDVHDLKVKALSRGYANPKGIWKFKQSLGSS